MSESVDPTLDPEGLWDMRPTSSAMVAVGGQLHVYAEWSHDNPRDEELVQEIYRYYHWDGSAWSEMGFASLGTFIHGLESISVSADGPSWSGYHLWRTVDGPILQTVDVPPYFVQTAAHPELPTSYAASRWGPHSDSLWSVSDGCVRQLWWRPECELDVYGMRMTLAADGSLFMLEGRDQLRVYRFDVDTVEIPVELDVPTDDPLGYLVGDIVVDSAGEIHTCYTPPELDTTHYGHGRTTEDWQQAELDLFGGDTCRVGATLDGSVIWVSASGGVQQTKPVAEPDPHWVPSDMAVFDVALSENDEVIALTLRVVADGPDELVLARLVNDIWQYETIDAG